MSIFERVKDSWQRGSEDNVGLLAAGVAFYFFLALVPLLAALVLTYGLVADPADAVRQSVAVARALPESAANLVIEQMRSLTEGDTSRTTIGLLIAIGTAIFGATKGAKAIIIALNIVNHVEQARGFIGQTRASLLIILALIAIMLAGFAAVALLGFAQQLLPGLPGWGTTLLKWSVWLGFAIIALISLSGIYRFAPATNRPEKRPSLIGAIVATILIGAGTLGFAFYVSNFGSYNATYGALGAVVVLQLWLYVVAYALLLGGEVAQSLSVDPA